MSYIFEYDDIGIWSPANRVGGLYVALADTLADITEVPHGMSPVAAGSYELDGPMFKKFVNALSQEYLGTHRTARSLVEGFKLTSLVLIDRMGVGFPGELDSQTMAGMEEASSGMAWL